MQTCTAVKATGYPCTSNVRGDGTTTLCRVHLNSRESKGPNKWAVLQLQARHKKEKRDFEDESRQTYSRMEEQRNNGEIPETHLVIYQRERAAQKRVLSAGHAVQFTDLVGGQMREIERTGINPDQAVIDRHIEERARRRAWENREAVRRREAAAQALERGRALRDAERRVQMLAFEQDDNEAFIRRFREAIEEGARVPPPPGGVRLEAFAADPQNIHTTATVQMTTKNIELLLAISVPDEYKWNRHTVSMTPFEIGMKCKLTHHATAEMMTRYMTPDTVYDLCEATYGRAMDGMWQFVKKSDDAECLYKIIKREMEDNIGMCAQGNLSRICNILGGYLDGIATEKESIASILGRLLPPLMEIEDDEERIAQARRIMEEHNVDEETRNTWMQAVA